MRLYYATGAYNVSIYDIEQAVNKFLTKYKVNPLTIKMRYDALCGLYSTMPKAITTLEKGKQYGQFYPIPGGVVELIIDDSIGTVISNPSSDSPYAQYILLENYSVDEAFEKTFISPI